MGGPPNSSGHRGVDGLRNVWPGIQNKMTRAARALVFLSLLGLKSLRIRQIPD